VQQARRGESRDPPIVADTARQCGKQTDKFWDKNGLIGEIVIRFLKRAIRCQQEDEGRFTWARLVPEGESLQRLGRRGLGVGWRRNESHRLVTAYSVAGGARGADDGRPLGVDDLNGSLLTDGRALRSLGHLADSVVIRDAILADLAGTGLVWLSGITLDEPVAGG
jgi:hypothetical protein